MDLHERLVGVIKEFFALCKPIMCESCESGENRFPTCICELLATHLEQTVYEDYKALKELLDAAISAQETLQEIVNELSRECDDEQR